MPERRRGRLVAAAPALAAAVVVMAVAAAGVLAPSGPRTEPLTPTAAGDVVLLSVPGLRWQDLEVVETPHLDRFLGGRALLSIRAIGPRTSLTEGYLTMGAGNRLEAEDPGVVAIDGDRACLPEVLAPARRSADAALTGAEPGALGSALAAAGVPRAVFGGAAAVAALMDGDGCVDVAAEAVPDQLPLQLPRGVTLVELAGLEATDVAARRTEVLRELDAALGRLDIPAGALVLVVAPAAVQGPGEVAEVTVAGAGLAAGDARLLASPTTRRPGYVTLSDVAPTVLAALGLDEPATMAGTPIASVAGTATAAGEGALADLAERVRFRDRAIGPASTVLVAAIVLCAVAAMAGRVRAARGLGAVAVALPTVAFASGAVAYHDLPLAAYVALLVLGAALLGGVASAATAALARGSGAAGQVTALAALLWLLLVGDLLTGGRLQLNTPFGYTPTVAGRFQGVGNLAFGLLAAAAVATAVAVPFATRARTRVSDGHPGMAGPVVWAGFVGAATVVVVAAPAFGSDVGGTLALVPAMAAVVALLAGRRPSALTVVGATAAAAAVVVGLAAVDRARPAAERTHLGRFLDRILDGDGGIVLRRKVRGNLDILTASVWSVLLAVILVAGAWILWRRRDRLVAAVAGRGDVRAFLAGSATVAVLGFVLNDSGIAVPAAMLAVVVPWCAAVFATGRAR